MLLDLRTLFGIAFAHNLAFGLIFMFIQGDYHGRMQESMKTWGRVHIISATGWALIASRGFFPEGLSILLGNSCLLLAQTEIIEAFRSFDHRLPARHWTIPAVLGAMLPVAYYLLYTDIPAYRILIISLLSALLHAAAAVHLKSVDETAITKGRLITSLGLWGLSVLFVVRALFILATSPVMNSGLESSPLESLIFGAGIFGMALVSYGFLIMCNEKFNSELKRLAAMDPLTGLYNRRALEEFARMEIGRVRRGGAPFLFMLIDMDLFKRINDSFGHAVGDIALKQVASNLRNNLRTQDIIGRLGGDEFAVLLPSTDRNTGETIARRLSDIILATPFSHNGQSIEMRVSIGIGEFCQMDGELDCLMSQADAELYQEKKKKKLTVA